MIPFLPFSARKAVPPSWGRARWRRWRSFFLEVISPTGTGPTKDCPSLKAASPLLARASLAVDGSFFLCWEFGGGGSSFLKLRFFSFPEEAPLFKGKVYYARWAGGPFPFFFGKHPFPGGFFFSRIYDPAGAAAFAQQNFFLAAFPRRGRALPRTLLSPPWRTSLESGWVFFFFGDGGRSAFSAELCTPPPCRGPFPPFPRPAKFFLDEKMIYKFVALPPRGGFFPF